MHSKTLYRLFFLMLVGLLALPLVAQESITLERREQAAFGTSVLVPQGWDEIAPGVYTPDRATLIIQQAAPSMTAQQILDSLLPSLLLSEVPEPVDTVSTNYFEWTLYQVDVRLPLQPAIRVDIALAEDAGTVHLLFLQASEVVYEAYHESVFLTALAGYAPAGAVVEESEPAATPAPAPVYEDPEGRYSVPIPTNWTAETREGYAYMEAPEGTVKVWIVAFLDEEDLEEAARQAWEIVGSEGRDLEYSANDTQRITDAAMLDGFSEALVITYENGMGSDGLIVQAAAIRYENETYVLIFDTTLVVAQQRAAQINLINTGFKVLSKEEDDLTGATPGRIDEALIAELEAFIEDAMAKLEAPGATLALVQDGEIVYTSGYGVKSLETGEAVDAGTLMMIGSTTKPMTTTLLAQEVDAGILDWDSPVVSILPEFAVKDEGLTQRITVENLVCACTGVPRRDFELLFNANELSAEDIVESLRTFEFFTDFGEAFQYSNQLVATAGYVAAAAAGSEWGDLYAGYEALLQERLLDPLGMARTTLSFDRVVADGNYAMPYGATLLGYEEIPLSTEYFVTPIAPSGALWSTAGEMAEFVRLMLAMGVAPDGERLLSEAVIARLWAPQVDISATSQYGLGWILEEYKKLPVIGHGGNTLGFTSDLVLLPEAGVGFVMLTNQQGSALNTLVRQRLLELLYGQEDETSAALDLVVRTLRDNRERAENRRIDIDLEALEPYFGDYSNAELGDLTMTLDGDRVLVDVGEFSTEVLLFHNQEQDITAYAFIQPPLAGLEFKLSEDDGPPSIIVGLGVVEYRFDKSE